MNELNSQSVCGVFFSFCQAWVQIRGFKTLRSRRLPTSLENTVKSESYTPAFIKVRTTLLLGVQSRYCLIDWVAFALIFVGFLNWVLNLLPLQGLLMRDKADTPESIDQFMKQRNLSSNQQDAFKTGFSEGFMKSQSLIQRTQSAPHS